MEIRRVSAFRPGMVGFECAECHSKGFVFRDFGVLDFALILKREFGCGVNLCPIIPIAGIPIANFINSGPSLRAVAYICGIIFLHAFTHTCCHQPDTMATQ